MNIKNINEIFEFPFNILLRSFRKKFFNSNRVYVGREG